MRFIFLLFILAISFNTYAQNTIKARNDTLYINYTGKADSVIFKCLDWSIKLNNQAKNWLGVIPVKNVNEFIAAYSFTNFKNGVRHTGPLREWAGKSLHPLAPRLKKIEGHIVNATIKSNFLNEERLITIYLPPGYNNKRKYPVIYMTDGKIVKDYAHYLEFLIKERQIFPLILVGIHAGFSPTIEKYDASKDRRALEYNKGFAKFVPGADSSIFTNHMLFFCKEVPAYIERHFSVSSQRADRVLYGFSNGGSFTVSVGLSYPMLFGNIISGSIGWELSLEVPNWDKTNYPRYHLVSGILEPGFLKTTVDWAGLLRKSNKEFFFKQYNSGHDPVMWRVFFLSRIQGIFRYKQPVK